ncbi:hypothetical protein A0J61_11260 [Choanephora cucurbitarum]|uniref:Uncharacterized protein n=1 Tax=Choanephora cucurbitarum TaxID=101091 RepID=A0A1C7MW88_9FUNG|nr:hypothetical protein A0J61_11260 [Choanephora cucurbitarum]
MELVQPPILESSMEPHSPLSTKNHQRESSSSNLGNSLVAFSPLVSDDSASLPPPTSPSGLAKDF